MHERDMTYQAARQVIFHHICTVKALILRSAVRHFGSIANHIPQILKIERHLALWLLDSTKLDLGNRCASHS